MWSLCCIYSVGHLLAWVSAAPAELLILMFSVSPGFHIGLCPHCTLGYAGVSPLQGSLSYWLFPQGFISGFALISPWAMQEYRPCRAHCRIGCVPRVSYRASPSFHPGLCRSVALAGLLYVFPIIIILDCFDAPALMLALQRYID